jgi:hypothetical protein
MPKGTWLIALLVGSSIASLLRRRSEPRTKSHRPELSVAGPAERGRQFLSGQHQQSGLGCGLR